MLAILSIMMGLLSLRVKSPDQSFNNELLLISLAFALMYTAWMIIKISRNNLLGYQEKIFWLTMAIVLPFAGALLFEIRHPEKKPILMDIS